MPPKELNMTMNSDAIWENAVINITFIDTRKARFRRWLAVRLITMAARVLGCGIEFVNERDDNE